MNDRARSVSHAARLGGLLVLMLLLSAPPLHAQLDSKHFSLHGYLRERLSMNLQNPPETPENDRYDVSMIRNTLYMEANAYFKHVNFTVIGRADYEIKTDYLDRLEDLSGANLMDFYNDADLREWYADIELGKRVTLRLGKQQVVWGKTDFFRGMDIIHGFDYTWRSFLEPENETLRKPLILANAQIQFPEVDGTLQLIVRPGFDRGEDIGNSYDLFGGRWANQPNKGVDFLALIPYNYAHPEADKDDANYGLRWYGRLGSFEYSLAYYHTLNLDPVVNSIFNPWIAPPVNEFAEFIYPKVDMYGVTGTYYLKSLDIVVRGEFALTQNQPYNIGTDFLGGALPGFAGIVQKDTLRSMLAFDKQARWAEKLLGASRPAFFNFQIFDTWLVDFKKADDIVDLAGYGAPKDEHSTIATVILGWNYNNDKINPTLAGGVDLSYGGSFLVPSVEFAWGNHWRWRVELDLFFPDDTKKPGEIEQQTHLLGYFANNDQLYTRLTYQF